MHSSVLSIINPISITFSTRSIYKSMARLFFKRLFLALLTFVIAIGGAVVGIIIGAIKGPTTETGLVRGACIGAVTGAITALQLMDMVANGEPFSKVSLLCSLVNGQIVSDWVTPAVLKAYQWQIGGVETTFEEIFDVFESRGSKGISEESINKLPKCVFNDHSENIDRNESNCAICLQGFKKREVGRELPKCRHVFHLNCIDEWLIRNGSCPMCRTDV